MRTVPTPQSRRRAFCASGFTLIELLVVVAVIAILASILLPTLERSKARAQGVFCVNNTKQLAAAWVLYADDHNQRLACNFGLPSAIAARPAVPSSNPINWGMNWVQGIMNWSAGSGSDNTNTSQLLTSGLGPYHDAPALYHCPSDYALSSDQRAAGWDHRVRSYSMNAMVGDAGDITQSGVNINNPTYVQFFRLSAIPAPSQIFVFLDEHPDSINDGYFLEKAEAAPQQWYDLPASYHDGAASFSFADGHAESHRWRYQSTIAPPQPNAAQVPGRVIPTGELGDFNWVIEHMTLEQPSSASSGQSSGW